MAADIAHSSLNLTPDEKRLYGQLFQQADTDGLGVVTGDVAVQFFEKTKLDQHVLGAIWQIGDNENRGLLTPSGFSVVLRLIGHAQAGRDPSEALANQPGPLPRFDSIPGISIPAPSAAPALAAQGTGGPIRVPPLSPEKVQEYASLFQKAGAQNGMLGGDMAKSVFERARLPNEVLGQIWALSDTKGRGALDSTDFIIAMHLITSMRSGAMRILPNTLPPGLYEAASRRGAAPASAIPRQLSGQPRTQSPRAFVSPPISAQTTGTNWLVSPQDKAKFDQIFASIDTSGQGTLTGEQAVSFFSNSGLPEETLAQIWDLADINSEGQLTRDEFAVAMYLIRQQRGRRVGDGRGDLPTVLPAQLIPPSMRQQVAPPSQPTAPVFDNATHATQQPKSAADDLFGLDALTGDGSPHIGGVSKSVDPFGNMPASPTSPKPQASARAAQPGGFKPFVPQSSFGQGIAAQNTGGSIGSTGSQPRGTIPAQTSAAALFGAPAPAPAAATASDDLLGDNDPAVSSKLTSETSELANMSNQIGTLRTQMQEVQNKKGTNERDLTTSNNQRKDLETRLATFRSQYEQEIREVKALEEQLTASRNETRQLQQQIAMIEGTHGDLKSQHSQLSTAFEADQKENASLKQRMQQLNAEINDLKPQIEKLKADSRQQKGLVAINKKQVATTELEHHRVTNEKTELENAPPPAAQPEHEVPAPSPAGERGLGSSVTSPAAVTTPGGTNPFFRKSPQASVDRSMAPAAFGVGAGAAAGAGIAAAANHHSAFDSFFGASEHSSTASPPPSTSFSGPGAGSSTDTPRAATPASSAPSTAPETPQGGLEPPAPPRSRQITPSNLPLRQENNRTESYSSSTKAVPPESRSGLSDVASPVETSESAVSSHAAETTLPSTSSKEIQETAASTEDHEAPKHGQIEQNDMPGAFPGEEVTPTASSAASKSEFDDAFSSFDKTEEKGKARASPWSAATGGAAAAGGAGAAGITTLAHNGSSHEFPPIRDIQEEDDSTESEGGFDDDFAPALSQPTTGLTGPGDNLQPSSQARTALTAEEISPPSAASQASPPPYAGEATHESTRRESNAFPPQFSGLLPSREMSNSPPEQVEQITPVSISSAPVASRGISETVNGTGAHAPTAAASAAPTIATTEHSATLPPAVTATHAAPADDFDDAFADLDEAKEDAVLELSSTRHEDAEFNPTFASPAPSRAGTADDAATPSRANAAASSFANFEPSFGGNQSFAATTSTAPPAGNSNHDWDAIFSGFDKPAAGADAGAKSPFDLAPAAPPATAASKLADRPELGRAISHGTEHDDPILKSLTSMGYQRGEALKALERFDYNLDKAADYLTSRH